MACRSLFVLLSLFFLPLCCLSFDLRILITPLVSSNYSNDQNKFKKYWDPNHGSRQMKVVKAKAILFKIYRLFFKTMVAIGKDIIYLWSPSRRYTAKPVLRDHYRDKENMSLHDRWPLKTVSIYMKYSMTWQENVILKCK